MLTQAQLKKMLFYDPESGLFLWVISGHGRSIGQIAGCIDSGGYMRSVFSGIVFRHHRLAFLYMTGKFPKDCVDHIDGDRTNNAWNNLREADKRLNAQNMKRARRDNSCGFLGVTPNGKRFIAQIKSPGKSSYIGTFDTPEEAHQAYLKQKRILHAGCVI